MTSPWTPWRRHFERTAARPLPPAAPPALDEARAAALLRSLRVFQLGETGEGRIVHQVRAADLPEIDDDYREALGLFVAEEGRHARILGRMIRSMGGQPLTHNWTHHLFEKGRRLLGVRTKLLVLLSAEVIAVGYYGALAERLPEGDARACLDQIRADEAHHLAFHAAFFRRSTSTQARRAAFVAAWAALAPTACAVVALDHRDTMRVFEVPVRELLARCATPAVDAVRAVLGDDDIEAPAVQEARAAA